MNTNNTAGNDEIKALLEKQASSSSSPSSSKGLTAISSAASQFIPTSITSPITQTTMTDALRRDINASRYNLNVEHNYKRSLEEITKSNTTTMPSSWLWKSASIGNNTHLSMEQQLRAQHEQLQRRNSFPAPASAAASELASLRSLKRQRLLGPKAHEIEGLEFYDAMKQMRQLDEKMRINMTPDSSSNSALLAEMASKMASRERRASIASSIASVGTSASAPNFTTANSLFPSPIPRTNLTPLATSLGDRSKVLSKLSSMGGGFPMPKFPSKSLNPIAGGGYQSGIPAEITPELGKDIVDVMRRESSLLTRNTQLEDYQQSRYMERIGGFPMPPLFAPNSSNTTGDNLSSTNTNEAPVRSSNAVSSHIRNTTNRSNNTRASRPPTLESYKRVWRDIRVVAGDDPQVGREVFARKLQRGEILVGSAKSKDRNVHAASGFIQQQQTGVSRGSGDNNNTGRRTNRGKGNDDIVI